MTEPHPEPTVATERGQPVACRCFRRTRTALGCGCPAAFVLLLTGLVFPFEAVFRLAFGWASYLVRALPLVSPNVEAIVLGAGSAVGLLVVGHQLASWLYCNWGAGPALRGRPWRVRWSLVGALLLMLAFTAGIAGIGIVHQTAWLARGPLLSPRGSGQRRTMSDLRTLGTAVEQYRLDYGHVPLSGEGPIARLADHLQPTYVKQLPVRDAWHSPIGWLPAPDGSAYSIVSLGRDRTADRRVQPGPTTSFDRDIYFADGRFTVFPEGTRN